MICARCLTEQAETAYRPEFHLYLCEKCNRARIVMREIFFGRKGMEDYEQMERETV